MAPAFSWRDTLTTAVIIQARMGSTRLPGKVMMELSGETVVAHVVRRARAMTAADVVCLATTELTADDPVAAEAARCGAEVFRGSEPDVLGRYLGAAKALDADVVVRITCDCPLIDPEVCSQAVQLRIDADAEYASVNTLKPGWPHGLDCEIFTTDLLERAAAAAHSGFEREHVTVWMIENPEVHKIPLPGPGDADIGDQRWSLDYPEDFAFFEALFEHLPAPPAMPGWREVMTTLRAHPEVAALNRGRHQAH